MVLCFFNVKKVRKIPKEKKRQLLVTLFSIKKWETAFFQIVADDIKNQINNIVILH